MSTAWTNRDLRVAAVLDGVRVKSGISSVPANSFFIHGHHLIGSKCRVSVAAVTLRRVVVVFVNETCTSGQQRSPQTSANTRQRKRMLSIDSWGHGTVDQRSVW